MSWGGCVERIENVINSYKYSRQSEEKKLPEGLRCFREYNIKMKYKYAGWCDLDLLCIIQGSGLYWTFVVMVMNIPVPYEVEILLFN